VGLQAQYLGGEAPKKSWSISARLRGFFDDNYTTSPSHLEGGDFMLVPGPGGVPTLQKKGPTKRGSWGVLAGAFGGYSPRLGELTTLGASLRYDMYYYEDRDRKGDEPIDHNVQAGAQFSHQFSDRYKLDVTDAFVVAQEPHVLDPTPMATTWLRSEGSNIRNTASAVGSAKLTAKLNVKASFSNTFYEYEQDDNEIPGDRSGDGTRSPLLDRMIHSGDLQLRWDFRPNTTAYVAYRFDYTDMTSKDRLWSLAQVQDYLSRVRALPLSPADAAYVATLGPTSNTAPPASTRDNYSHFAYLGVDHQFNAFLSAQAMVGGQFTEFPNARERTVTAGVTAWKEHARENISPYANVNVRYDYAKNCVAQLGFIHARNSTDVAQMGGVMDADSLIGLLLGEYTTLDQESTTAYGSIIHSVTAKLRLNLRAQWQGSMFNQKNLSGMEDDYAGVDIKADYEINKYLFAEAGYGFDLLCSDLPDRGFTRNRVFLGIRGTY
jgi:hypothetical protein